MSGVTRRELLAGTAAAVAVAATGVTAAGMPFVPATAAPVMTRAAWLARFDGTLRSTLPGLVRYGTCRWHDALVHTTRCPPIIVLGEDAATRRLVALTIARIANHGPFAAVDLDTLAPAALESRLFEAFRAAHGGILFLDNIHRLPRDLDRRIGGLIAYGADVWVVATAWRRLEGHEIPDSVGTLPLMGWPLLTPPLPPAAVEELVQSGARAAREWSAKVSGEFRGYARGSSPSPPR